MSNLQVGPGNDNYGLDCLKCGGNDGTHFKGCANFRDGVHMGRVAPPLPAMPSQHHLEGVLTLGGPDGPRFDAVVVVPPTQYPLLHNAAALARKLEAAGLPEGDYYCNADDTKHSFGWPALGLDDPVLRVDIHRDGEAVAWIPPEHTLRWRAFDQLPDTLVAAIKATAGA